MKVSCSIISRPEKYVDLQISEARQDGLLRGDHQKCTQQQDGGKKDIIKVECPIDELDLNVLGFIDHRITVNIIQNGTIVAKKELNLPKKLVNIISCKKPALYHLDRAGTRSGILLADKEREIYRCQYCEEKYQSSKQKK